MLFHSRTFWLPKDAEHPGEYEDAYAVDEERGRVAIADGVSSAIFSRQWARILTRTVLENPPDLADGAAFQRWLAALRKEWALSIDVSSLKWNQRAKLETGAFSTLQWLELFPGEAEGEFVYRSIALGDCCLFHVRDGQLLTTFPIENVEEFGLDPLAVGSINKGRDHVLEFQGFDGTCRAGDLIALCTDALALWAFKQLLAEQPVDWAEYWHVSPEEWAARIESIRRAGDMRYDDTTLLLLWIGDDAPRPEYLSRIPPEIPAEAEDAAAPLHESVSLDIAPAVAESAGETWVGAEWPEELAVAASEESAAAAEFVAANVVEVAAARAEWTEVIEPSTWIAEATMEQFAEADEVAAIPADTSDDPPGEAEIARDD